MLTAGIYCHNLHVFEGSNFNNDARVTFERWALERLLALGAYVCRQTGSNSSCVEYTLAVQLYISLYHTVQNQEQLATVHVCGYTSLVTGALSRE